ncbi:MAG: thioredoxin family protein [Myxococcales bacterium]|nr:thioredoxin family protein [Myxococcales bacterium]
MNIKVLGPGCVNCKTMLERTKEALQKLGLQAEIEYLTDMDSIHKYVALTPGLVVDEKVVHQGKPLPSVEKIEQLIQGAK